MMWPSRSALRFLAVALLLGVARSAKEKEAKHVKEALENFKDAFARAKKESSADGAEAKEVLAAIDEIARVIPADDVCARFARAIAREARPKPHPTPSMIRRLTSTRGLDARLARAGRVHRSRRLGRGHLRREDSLLVIPRSV